MKQLSIMIIGLFLSVAIQAQSLEMVVKAWFEDAPNGFHNAFQQYGRGCGGHCVDIDALYGSSSGSRYQAFFELKPKGSMVDTYKSIKSDMENWAMLEGWESSSSVYTNHNITYSTKKENGERWYLALKVGQNYDASKPEILSLMVSRSGLKTSPVAVPDKETLPLPSAAPASIVNLKSRLANEKGKTALQQLIAAADNEFEDIIIHNSFNNGVYQVKESYLNPKANKPFITVKEEPRKRVLTLRFQIEKVPNHLLFHELLYEPYNYQSVFKETEWDINPSDSWSAIHKTKLYLYVEKGFENGMDVMKITSMKKGYRNILQTNPDFPMSDCLEGDCLSGFGILKYTKENRTYRYEGGFKNGKFHGTGYLYMVNDSENGLTFIDLERNREGQEMLLYIGHHKNGKRDGKGMSYAYTQYKDPVRSFRKAEEYFLKEDQTGVFNYVFQSYAADTLNSERLCSFTYHKDTPERQLTIEQPFSTDYGNCISGNCENGTGVLSINGLGQYEGEFVNGQADGTGILKLATGEWKEFECHSGIPEYIRSLKLPKGVSRLAAAQRGVWLLADHDCIKGNCYDGEGLQLRINADRFRRYNVRYHGYVESRFQKGVAEGAFTIRSLKKPLVKVEGQFKKGVFDGTLNVLWTESNTSQKEYYQAGRRVTENGQDYAEYQQEQLEAWQKDYERKLQKAREEGIAEAKRLRAEAEALRRAANKKKAASQQKRSHRCNSCDGTGSYWNEIVTQDCTITYDYTYTSGKYYQTYTHCRDVKKGGYIVCPVCGGKGRY